MALNVNDLPLQLIFVRFPEKQSKLRDHLRESRANNVLDSSSSPAYLKAFLMEVFRYMRQSGLGPVKNAEGDVRTRGGLRIPKGVR